nr:PREDICTED: zinc finger protein 385B-like [Latimeria chalumnae]|eukprot:XP_014346805.1 PREDICTED: zinc finger protein 385B-like [Latimeria chalumnae]
MKRPLSPDCIPEDGTRNTTTLLTGLGEKRLRHEYLDSHQNKEKKKLVYMVCEVCNIQLNSAPQAQVHYNGKSHLKRVKQLNNGQLPTSTAVGMLGTGTSTGDSHGLYSAFFFFPGDSHGLYSAFF